MSAAARTLCILAAGSLCPVADAAQWDVLPFGSVGGYYETNVGLNPVNSQEVSVSGAQAEAGVAFRALTPKNTFLFRPHLTSTYFPGETEADYNNAFAELNFGHTGLRSNAAMNAEYSRETVSSASLPGTDVRGDLGNPRDGDVTLVTTRSKRDMLNVFPTAAFYLTPRNTLQLTGNYVDVSYDRKIPGDELGYTFLRGGVGWQYSTSELSTLALTLAAQKFDPEDAPGFQPSVGSTSNVLIARWTRSLDAKRRFYVESGSTHTKFDRTAGSVVAGSTKSGYNGGIGASWELQTTSLFVDLTHSVQPSSSGAVSNQTDARLRLIRSLSARWRATLGARAIQSKAVDPNVVTDDRQYAIASIGIEWRWKPQWSVNGSFDFVHQKLENQTGADSSRLILALAYDAGRR